jgi:DNA-binding MarR family transcriptional regulator
MELSSGIMDMIYQMKKKCAYIDQKLMDELNLSQSELQFFSSLDNCMVINSNELGRTMGLSPSRVSRVVDKLVLNGYLDRSTDTSDRRAIVLCLTQKGKEIKDRISQERLHCEKQVLKVLPEEEIQKFHDIMGKIINTL